MPEENIKNTSEKAIKEEELNLPKELQDFLKAGVHFGHKKSVIHPHMLPYIFGVRNNVHIIDIVHTQQKLKEAIVFIKKLIKEGKVILFVNTKVPTKKILQSVAEATKMPYVTTHWFGGTLTNWNTISERIQYMQDLRKKIKSEEWKKYTKHERLQMERKLEKLEQNLGGIENMKKLPDALFIVDIKKNSLAAKEARMKNIPSIAITDTNVNPQDVTYPIPANDDSVASVKLILNKIQDAILKNQTITKPKKSESKKTPQSLRSTSEGAGQAIKISKTKIKDSKT